MRSSPLAVILTFSRFVLSLWEVIGNEVPERQ